MVNPTKFHSLHLHCWLHPTNPDLNLLDYCFRARILGHLPSNTANSSKTFPLVLPPDSCFHPRRRVGSSDVG